MRFKEKDIRDNKILKKYLKMVRKDSESILKTKNSMEYINPNKWGLGKTQKEFEKSGFVYEKCLETGTLIVNPRPKFNILNEFYSSSKSGEFWVNKFFLPKSEIRREKIFRPRASFIKQKFRRLNSSKIGEIGSGFGIFIEELQKLHSSKLNIEAIEPSSLMAEICREKGINVNENMLERISPTTNRYDILICFELFEHLQDPLDFLERCFKLLNPGGYLIITTLSSHGFDIQLLWEKSNSIFPPHHLNFFNPVSIKKIFSIAGFCNIEINTPGELDVDIVRNFIKNEKINLPRFFETVLKHGASDLFSELQVLLKNHNFSSHMRVIAQKSIQ